MSWKYWSYFFTCHLAKLLWEVIVIAEIFQLSTYPTSWDDFCDTWLRGKGPVPTRLIIFLFSGFAWALWTTINKIAIEKMTLEAPTGVIYTLQFHLCRNGARSLRSRIRTWSCKSRNSLPWWCKKNTEDLYWTELTLPYVQCGGRILYYLAPKVLVVGGTS